MDTVPLPTIPVDFTPPSPGNLKTEVVQTTVAPILALSLTLYAYFLGAMFFAPIIPSVIVLVAYVAVVEAITWITYYLAGWTWNAYTRTAIVVATLLGYAIGMGIYKVAGILTANTSKERTTTTTSRSPAIPPTTANQSL